MIAPRFSRDPETSRPAPRRPPRPPSSRSIAARRESAPGHLRGYRAARPARQGRSPALGGRRDQSLAMAEDRGIAACPTVAPQRVEEPATEHASRSRDAGTSPTRSALAATCETPFGRRPGWPRSSRGAASRVATTAAAAEPEREQGMAGYGIHVDRRRFSPGTARSVLRESQFGIRASSLDTASWPFRLASRHSRSRDWDRVLDEEHAFRRIGGPALRPDAGCGRRHYARDGSQKKDWCRCCAGGRRGSRCPGRSGGPRVVVHAVRPVLPHVDPDRPAASWIPVSVHAPVPLAIGGRVDDQQGHRWTSRSRRAPWTRPVGRGCTFRPRPRNGPVAGDGLSRSRRWSATTRSVMAWRPMAEFSKKTPVIGMPVGVPRRDREGRAGVQRDNRRSPSLSSVRARAISLVPQEDSRGSCTGSVVFAGSSPCLQASVVSGALLGLSLKFGALSIGRWSKWGSTYAQTEEHCPL